MFRCEVLTGIEAQVTAPSRASASVLRSVTAGRVGRDVAFSDSRWIHRPRRPSMGLSLQAHLEDEVHLVIVDREVVFTTHYLEGDRCAAPLVMVLGP